MSLQETEAECAKVATASRVALADIEAAIKDRYNTTAAKALGVLKEPLTLLSICILVMQNGFVVIGKSAPASAANFNAELGKRLAYEDCIRQLWPLMGYALRDRLS